MIEVNKAINLVRQKGNNLDRLRLRFLLDRSCKRKEVGHVLGPYQFPDGSWDYDSPEENSDRIGSLGGTIHCLRWLREFDMGSSPQMVRALEFLIAIQNPDGSFYETEAKLTHSPQSWLQEETMIDRFYFTAAVPMRLSSLGYDDHTLVEPAVQWLANHWADWELLTGTWYNVWAVLCSPAASRLDDQLYTRCCKKAAEWIPHLGALPLAWFLDACEGGGLPADNVLVKKGIARLSVLQNEEGVWPNPHSPIETTVTALRLLKTYGILEL
jgi:hypothetical protein